MAFTRDWLSSWILDHSKFKEQPGYVRGLMDDVGERLAAYLYGFTTTETFTGFKKVTLVTIGTGSGSIPTGTGVQAAINLQGKTIDGKVELITIDADGNEIQFTSKGAFLANNAWLTANLVGTAGNLNILKVNTANQIEIGTSFGTHLVGPDTGPTADLQYAPKGYVDLAVTNGLATLPITTGPAAGEIPKLDSNGYITPYLRVYDTGAQTWAANTNYTVTHNFNTTKVIVQFMFRPNSGVPWGIATGHRDQGQIGVCAYEINVNTILFYENPLAYYWNGGGYNGFSSGQYRVIVLALE